MLALRILPLYKLVNDLSPSTHDQYTPFYENILFITVTDSISVLKFPYPESFQTSVKIQFPQMHIAVMLVTIHLFLALDSVVSITIHTYIKCGFGNFHFIERCQSHTT